ncbi:MAG: DUF883 family protein [Candidatus Nitrosoglobus sp.]|jgi:ElaB/YqjD/DUF883 family membrane-anchored ribosome-binding protein
MAEPIKLDDLKEEFNQLRKEMRDVLSEVRDKGQNAGRTIRARAEEGLDQASDRLGQAYESTRRAGANAAERTRGEIESHPVASISLALVVGIVLGNLISLK